MPPLTIYLISSTIIRTMSTTVSKFSVSMPSYIYEQLAVKLGKREVSGFIADAVEKRLLDETIQDDVEAFIAIRQKLPKVSVKAIQEAIEKGRT